ncbi:MAG: hypothetical protein OK456_11445 [Thaumarchaeota archaeon]|nr:hypothetical protein [Nitrososphaerota archaeon]
MKPPVRLTALYHRHLALKATMVESEGWLLPESYVGPEKEIEAALKSVGLSDSCADLKIDVRGGSDEIDGFLGEILLGGAVSGRPGEVVAYPITGKGDDSMRYACRLASDHALLVLRPKRASSRSSPLEPETDTPKNHDVYLTNATSVLAGITVFGPQAPRLLSRLSSVDLSLKVLPNPSCTEGGVAGIQCAIIRSDITVGGKRVDMFDCYFGRGYAEFLWDAMNEAGHEFNIAPVGTTARDRLLARAQRTDVGVRLER